MEKIQYTIFFVIQNCQTKKVPRKWFKSLPKTVFIWEHHHARKTVYVPTPLAAGERIITKPFGIPQKIEHIACNLDTGAATLCLSSRSLLEKDKSNRISIENLREAGWEIKKAGE